jgi:sugar lactone lactonase YvrE
VKQEDIMRQPFLAGLALSAWALVVLGCDSSTNGPTEPSLRGILAVTITAPSGVTPSVMVDGPTGYSRSLVTSQSLTLAPGSYTVTAASVEVVDPIVGTRYEATVTGGTVPVNGVQVSASVRNAQTVTVAVSYAARPGSGALWVTSGGPHIRAYSTAALQTGGTPTPRVDLFLPNFVPIAVAFDSLGNLWTASRDHGSGFLRTFFYPVDQLGSSDNPGPLDVGRVASGSPQGLAFDCCGDLWVTNKDASTILGFTGLPFEGEMPAVTLSATSGSLNGPAAIAFDRNGNLWVANNTGNTVAEFTASQFATSGSPAPILKLSAASGSLDGPFGLAFDTQGNLWVTNRNANTVVEFGGTQLAASGSPTPIVTLSASGGSLAGPTGVAFDASGNLWVANDIGRSVVEFGATQLRTSGAPTPVVTLGGLEPSGPIGLAFDPPTAPLYPHVYDPWLY